MHNKLCQPIHTDHCLHILLVVLSLKDVSEACLVKDIKAGQVLGLHLKWTQNILVRSLKNIIPEDSSKAWPWDKWEGGCIQIHLSCVNQHKLISGTLKSATIQARKEHSVMTVKSLAEYS